MLYYVSGMVSVLEPGLAVVDCHGVGYGCRVTAYTAAQLKLGKEAKLFITESIREDAFDLYGFISREEQRCSSRLIKPYRSKASSRIDSVIKSFAVFPRFSWAAV